MDAGPFMNLARFCLYKLVDAASCSQYQLFYFLFAELLGIVNKGIVE